LFPLPQTFIVQSNGLSTQNQVINLKTVKMKKNKYIYLFTSVLVSQFFISCNQDSIDKVNSPIAYESGGFENSDDIAAANLITKFSFENSISDSKRNNWWCRYGCKLCTRHQGQAYQGSSSSFIAYNNVANPLIAIKALLFLCGLKQTHIQEDTIFIYVTKTTDFWVISSH
jgi:hypothetical protein